jgi:hypothetical protein
MSVTLYGYKIRVSRIKGYGSSTLKSLYSSSNIIKIIKLRRLRWTWHVTNRDRKEVYTKPLQENMKESATFRYFSVITKITYCPAN